MEKLRYRGQKWLPTQEGKGAVEELSSIDAISGATCASNAAIVGAIKAWMRIMTERRNQEAWMETINAETTNSGWENIAHETVELPADAQIANVCELYINRHSLPAD